MDQISYKTANLTPGTIRKNWVVVDANQQVLGRLASRIAFVLKGKNKPGYTPFMDCGDNVIVINAEKVRLTGRKATDKIYIRHTGYPGGQRFSTPRSEGAKGAHRIIEMAVKGMLPKNRLGRRLFTNLYVYAGTEHPHAAQNPELITL